MWEEQVCWWTIIFQIMEHYEDRWGPLLGLSEELVIKIVQCPDRSWYSHIKQQREAQFICTGVRVSQLDAIIPLQCATNEEEASYWLTDWLTVTEVIPHSSPMVEMETVKMLDFCSTVIWLIIPENFSALTYHRSLYLPFTFALT